MGMSGHRGFALVGALCGVLLALSIPSSAAAGSADVLELGSPKSPVLEQLREDTNIDLDDVGSPSKADPSRYGALVLDGDQLTPDEVRNNWLIQRFVSADRWVAAVDVNRAEIEALRTYAGFAVADHRTEFIMFRVGMAEGSPMVDVVDSGAPGVDSAEELNDRERRRLREYDLRRVTGLVAGQLDLQLADVPSVESRGALTDKTEKAPCGTLTPTPLPGLQHIGWCYTTIGSQVPRDGHWGSEPWWVDRIPSPGSQTANWTMHHRFDVFLDNDPKVGSAKGNFDVVYYSLNGDFAPKRDTENFYRMYQGFTSGWNSLAGTKIVTERAWWTGRAEPSVRPQGGTGALLAREDSQPQSKNGEVSYSSSDSFSVGFSGTVAKPDGGLGLGAQVGWTSEKGKSFAVPDWGVQNKSSGRDAAWVFSSRQPCDLRPENEGSDLLNTCFVDGGVGKHYPAEPNEISRTSLRLGASARWRTSNPIETGSKPLSMAVSVPIRLNDTYCSTSWNGGGGFCPFGISSGYGMDSFDTGPATANAQIEADWVNPVGIESLQLSSNRAKGDENERVTGTVTLKRAPNVPVDVQVIAVGPNARLADPYQGVADGSQELVRVDPGKTSAKFTVYTNANKLTAGESSTTLINAFYAERADPVELKVVRAG